MRHQADDGALFVADPGDVPDRAVRVGPRGHLARLRRIAEDDLLALPELAEEGRLDVVAPFAVGDRHLQDLTTAEPPGERTLGLLDGHVSPLAAELEALVPEKRTGKEA